jgi:hypothetical protein
VQPNVTGGNGAASRALPTDTEVPRQQGQRASIFRFDRPLRRAHRPKDSRLQTMSDLAAPEFQGYFWLPDKPERKVPGHFLRTADGRLQLNIVGTFSGRPIELDDRSPFRILGLSENGKSITLEGCLYTNRSFNFPGLPTAIIFVHFAFIGCHFKNDEPIQFDSIYCYSEAVDIWMRFAPMEVTLSTNPQKSAISFSPPSPLEYELPDDLKFNVRCTWSAPSATEYREARIKQKTWVGFEFPRKANFKEMLTIVNQFSNFVSFVIDQTIAINVIEVYSKELVQKFDNTSHMLPVQIVYQPINKKSPDISKIQEPFPLFSFENTKDKFQIILSGWLENYKIFESSFNLYFGTKSEMDLYLDNRFLMLVQALEALHRNSSDNTLFSTKDYEELSSILKTGIPDKYKEWLQSRLKYGNELPLRQRLKSLFSGFEEVFGGKKELKGLISYIVNTRNYLTHYDKSLHKKSAKASDLHKLCLALEALFQLHMARMCGFSIEEVIELCSRSELFRRKISDIHR